VFHFFNFGQKYESMNIQFSHANGFGASTYNYFFSLLKPHTVKAVELIGHGKYPVAPNWKPLAKELIEYIETHHNEPVIGIGHSLGGAITLYAVLERPDLFRQVIFLDPPIFGAFKRSAMSFLKNWTNQYDKISPSGRTLTRKQFFETKVEAFEYFKPKSLFKNFAPVCFEDYVNNGLKVNEEYGFELAFSRSIEYQVFRAFPNFKSKIELPIPSQFIYSNQYKVLWKSDIQFLKSKLKGTEFIKFDGGHLFPMEKPKETVELIKSLIK